MFLKYKCGRLRFGLSVMLEGKKDVYGYTNRCDDGKFIVFLDYDEIPLEWIKVELSYLQKDFNLGDFYLFEGTVGNFHAISFTKVNRNELYEILSNSSMDENYWKVPYTIGKRLLTLRFSDKKGKKPYFIGKISRVSDRLESYEHKKLINKLFNCIDDVSLKSNNDYNCETKLIISKYKVVE